MMGHRARLASGDDWAACRGPIEGRVRLYISGLTGVCGSEGGAFPMKTLHLTAQFVVACAGSLDGTPGAIWMVMGEIGAGLMF